MKTFISIAFIMTLIISSCSIKKKKVLTAEGIVAQMQSKYPNYTVADIKYGKSIYETNCKTCHELKEPTSLDEAGWKKIVPPMCDKVNENKKVLGAKEQELILRYLVSMSTIAGKN